MSEQTISPIWYFRLLGSPRILRGGEELAAFQTSKSQAILIYLAVRGGIQPRTTLAELFWPGVSESQAGASLRNALSGLRRLVSSLLVTTRHTVALQAQSAASDVAQFNALLQRTGDQTVDIVQMQAAISLYAGDFLEGFHVSNAPEFEQWVAHERERLRDRMLNALLTLADWQLNQRDYSDSLDHLNRLLALDPASELGHRKKMEALARMGQRSAALLQFEACCHALQEELGVDPAPATLALRDLILSGTLDAYTPSPTTKEHSPATSPPSVLPGGIPTVASEATAARRRTDWGDMPDRSTFYGRDTDLAQLHRWLTVDGAGLVVISGMGGVGKTALAAEALARLAPQTYELIVWRSLVNMPSMASLVDTWLQALIGYRLESLPSALEEKLALLFDHLRDQRCLLILDNAESVMQPGARRGHFRPGYEGLAQLIARMAKSRHKSCLLITTRELPLGLQRLEEDYPRVRMMNLAGLSTAAGLQLLQDRGVTAPRASLEALVERYSGNPLALKLVAHTVRDLFGADVDAFLHDTTPVFDDIRGVLDDHYGRLSDRQRELVTWLAIERRPLPVQALRQVLVHPPSQGKFLEEVLSLRRGSMVDEVASGDHDLAPRLGLQNVVMEYVTERLIGTLQDELESGRLDWLHRHALVVAQRSEQVKESQRRLHLQPLAQWLMARYGRKAAAQRLQALLRTIQQESRPLAGYGAANILHLLLHLQVDLTGTDLSRLPIWQADLRSASLVDVDLHGADLTGCTFSNRFGAISTVAVSPDGRLLAGGGTDGVVHVWSIADFRPAHALRGHDLSIMALAFSDDGCFLVSSGRDDQILVWDMQSGLLVRRPPGSEMQNQAISLSVHGDLLAVAGIDKAIHVWNWPRGQRVHLLGASTQTNVVAFSPDGRLLAGVCVDLTLNVWEVGTGELIHVRPTASRMLALAFSADGEMLATGGEDSHIQLWNVRDLNRRQTLAGHQHWILSLAFSPDGKHLASGSADHTARLWDIAAGRQARVLTGHGGWVRAVAYTPDGQGLVTGADDQTVRLWDTHTGELRHYLQGHLRWIDFIRFSHDGRTLISISFGGAVRLWDVDSGQLLHQLEDRQTESRAAAFSHDGRLVACGCDDHTARVWEVRRGALQQTLRGHQGPVRDIAFSPDDRYLITGSHDQTLRVWEVARGQLRQTIPDANARLQFAMATQPKGDLLAFGALDHTVKLLSLDAGQIVASLPMADKAPGVVAFSPRGDRLAGGGGDGSVWVWDLAEAGVGVAGITAPVRQVQPDPQSIWRLLFSPDGQLLACAGEGQYAQVIDISTGQLRYAVRNRYGAYCLDFSRDGRYLLTSGADNEILLRDSASGEVERSLPGHTAEVTSLAVSPDGETIASSSGDGTVRVWHLHTGRCLAVLEPRGPYAGMNISGVTGITPAQRTALKVLGAVEG